MDIFLSYSSADPELRARVFELLDGTFGYKTFVDLDIAGGLKWQKELREHLGTQHHPDVVVLVTASAAKAPWVQEEVRLALAKGLTVIPIEFDEGAVKRLAQRANLPELEEIQYIRASEPDLDWKRLEKSLRIALCRRRVLHELETRETETRAWITSQQHEMSFWNTLASEYLTEIVAGNDLVLRGTGGAGKSTLAGRIAERLIQRRECGAVGAQRLYPILLSETDLRDGGETLARSLGAPSAEGLAEYLQGCREEFGLGPVFVIDGLDQMAPGADATYAAFKEALRALTLAAPALVTCRTVVWTGTYASEVSAPARTIETLAPDLVRALTAAAFPDLSTAAIALLRQPIFLDLALRHANAWETVPETDVSLLQRTWMTLTKEVRAEEVGGNLDSAHVLETLAELQLETMEYPVDVTALGARLGSDVDPLLDRLVAERWVQRSNGPAPKVRLVHDLLDGFNMARRLMACTSDERQQAYDVMHEDAGWSTVALLAAASTDGELERSEIIEELFERFLYELDRKRWESDPQHMNRSWAATYALQDRLSVFLPLILRCFENEELADTLADGTKSGGSSLKEPSLTQEAASTLASAFQGLRRGCIEDAETVIPVLEAQLEVWEYRGRLIEAIAKYDHHSARTALIEFARRRIEDQEDPEALEYAARELRHFDARESIDVLDEIYGRAPTGIPLRRIAAESLCHLRPGRVEIPSRSDEELILELRPYKINRAGEREPGYTDWMTVERAALEIEERIREDWDPSNEIVSALILALEHDQSAVRVPVARDLGMIDDPRATFALVSEMLEPGTPNAVLDACANSLEQILARTTGPQRMAVRVLLLRAAREASRLVLSNVEARFESLALKTYLPSDPALNPGAAMMIVAEEGENIDAQAVTDPPSEAVVSCFSPEELAAAGPEFEPKFRFVSFDREDGQPVARMAPSTWALGSTFHRTALEGWRIDELGRDGLRLPPPLGTSSLPGIASVHGIVTTQDGQILLAQRAYDVRYSPGHWSISFEEQVTARADGQPETPIEALLRGLHEEFGITAEASDVRWLGGMLEVANLNLALVYWLRVNVTSAALKSSWEGPPRPSHHHEAIQVEFVEKRPETIQELLQGDATFAPLHPTSRMRLALLLSQSSPRT